LKIELTNKIKSKAKLLGFNDCGISRVQFANNQKPFLLQWLKNNFNGQMQYMENNLEKRLDPAKLFENAKSIISVIINYFPKELQNESAPQIAKYAYGKDYHIVIKDKLNKLLNYIKTISPNTNGRVFVDSAPVLDKYWAMQSGLGWIGKNTLLISKNNGSFVFVGEIIADIELNYDNPIKDFCGSCNKCLEACPTKALIKPYILDARKCISYYTNEKYGTIQEELRNKFKNCLYGCDICQDVCPWNKKPSPSKITEFEPNPEILKMTKDDWINLSEKDFNKIFKDSTIKQDKFKSLKRNIQFIK